MKGELETVWELLFQVSDYYISGETLYKKYRKVLHEADSILISGNFYNYKNYRKRVLLNYALGFMKIEVERKNNDSATHTKRR